ncbi:coiled-coil domain-containing protein [Pseudomonas sp. DWP1b1]|uniref:coiled-coil domain-containing protein n=1 Tax=unclassified Pseudomonas TaxID=196821 RepID=UPI003CF57872
MESVEDLDTALASIVDTIPPLNTLENPLWKTTAQCQILLAESGATSKPIKITSSAKRFTPDKLFFLDCIYFYGDAPDKILPNLSVTIKPIGKPAHTVKLFMSTTPVKFCYAHARVFCEWFEISSDTIFGKPTLNKIKIYGSDLIQLQEYSKDVSSIIDLRGRIDTFKTSTKKELSDLKIEIANLTESSEELNNLVSETNDLIANLKKESEDLKAKNAVAQEKLTKLQLSTLITSEKNSTESNNLTQLTQTAKSLNEEISNLKSSLTKLTNDKNLISDEYGPYVKEGKSQATIYILIVTLPLLAILFSVYELYAGASKILTNDHNSLSEVAAAFILRIPFAAVFGLAVYYSWRLTSSIIQRIFTIHGDRLALAKLLVLAREATHSSAKNLNLPTEVIYQEQLKFKVEVLKSHLSKELGKDFEYTTHVESKSTDKPTINPAATNDDNIPDIDPAINK